MRTVIQIVTMPAASSFESPTLWALCDDGTMWVLLNEWQGWSQVVGVPQGDEVPT